MSRRSPNSFSNSDEIYVPSIFGKLLQRDGRSLTETPDDIAEIWLGAQRVEMFQESDAKYSLVTNILSA